MLQDRWRVLLAALIVALALGAASCGDDDEEEPAGGGATATEEGAAADEFPAGSTMAKIQEKGEITIGVKYDVPPFGFKNPESGAVEGFDVDFGKAVAGSPGGGPKVGAAIFPEDSDIAGIDDLAGRKVCTALGSTYEETLKTQAPEADLRLVDAYSECLELLQNGAIDAISTDGVIEEYKSSGAWQESYDSWLGQYTGEQQTPPDQTLEEVLAAE